MHTHLKGRIFNQEGTSYLVMNEQEASPEWVRVKALDATRTVRRMAREDVQQHLAKPRA